jgi:hypothetical protein
MRNKTKSVVMVSDWYLMWYYDIQMYPTICNYM